MLEILAAVAEALRRRAVPHALIGAAAMAARGVIRSTDDLDLLVTDTVVLRPGFWAELTGQGFAVEARVGDDEDPLAGVVRLTRPPARALDVVVGRKAWQAELITRAEPIQLGTVTVPLASPADLILLKLYAGGGQDLRDVQSLLDAGERASLRAAVEAELGQLPAEARDAWQALVSPPGRPR
jgi:hypothetical protein